MKSNVTVEEKLTLNSASRAFLKETAKWTSFLSVVGFVFVGLLVIIGITAGTFYGSFLSQFYGDLPFDMGLLMTAFYLIMAVIYYFPILFLYKFSRRLGIALRSMDDNDLASALEMLKSHYKFVGVLMIIVLSLYALVIATGLLGLLA